MQDRLIDDVVTEIEAAVRRLEDAGASRKEVDDERRRLLKETRTGSRFVGENASDDFVEHIAKGGSYQLAPNTSTGARGTRGLGGLAATMSKALGEGTPSAGGYLVPVEVAAEVLTLLRARSAVNRLGPTTIHVEKELDITSISSGATAYWTAENAQIPVSEQTFASQVLLRPKDLASLVPVSNRLLRDAVGAPDIERVIREDLAEVMALREDLAYVQGTGTGGEPLGIRNTPGTTAGPSFGANGRSPSFDDLKAMVASVRALNAPFRRPGWLFNPRLLSTLETVKDTTGRYLADAGLLEFDAIGGGGTLLGFPFVTTSQIPIGVTTGSSSDTSYIVFSSDWQEAYIGENLGLTIEVSAEASYWDGAAWVSAFQNRQSLFRSVRTVDFALRRPQLFVISTGVRP